VREQFAGSRQNWPFGKSTLTTGRPNVTLYLLIRLWGGLHLFSNQNYDLAADRFEEYWTVRM